MTCYWCIGLHLDGVLAGLSIDNNIRVHVKRSIIFRLQSQGALSYHHPCDLAPALLLYDNDIVTMPVLIAGSAYSPGQR